MLKKAVGLIVSASVVLTLFACTPAAAPTAVPTKAPTTAPAKAAEPTKPVAAAPTAAPAATATPAPAPATVRYGTTQLLNDVGVFVAMEKGYFKEQGITVEVVPVPSSSQAIPLLGTDKLDVVAASLSMAILSAVDRGVELKIAADEGQSRPGGEMIWIALRKDLADSGQIKSAADLKGQKVAITSLGAISEQAVQIMQQKDGLQPGFLETVVMNNADQPAAFSNKAIAAGYLMEPMTGRAFQDGLVAKWKPLSSLYGGTVQFGFTIFGPTLTKNPDLARRWMIGYLQGVRTYLKAKTSKVGWSDVVNAMVKYSNIKDPKLYDIMEMPYIDPNGQLDRQSMNTQYKWFVDKGLYTGKVTFDQLIDLSFADYAVQKLGKQ